MQKAYMTELWIPQGRPIYRLKGNGIDEAGKHEKQSHFRRMNNGCFYERISPLVLYRITEICQTNSVFAVFFVLSQQQHYRSFLQGNTYKSASKHPDTNHSNCENNILQFLSSTRWTINDRVDQIEWARVSGIPYYLRYNTE